ncbi:DWD (DDB1-binding WD40 protein) hypersensitive to ABA 1 [Actinidia rufa]|uniref:DWD (DDB1-binding WD40 protein) hypersensitive to ABA 1 n=1 Tax=Actinidia rufa TaxID=165716 RepID=A0A7J0DW20_9ERIC|nr:DWD (DDB1-binding WD40 protein) hypersensitive to ABA 1 [Actinidia rufa]
MGLAVDCRKWDEAAYRSSIVEERESQCRTVFRTAFPPSPHPNPNPDLIVAASSDGSVNSYSLSSLLFSLPVGFGFGNDRGQNLLNARPQCFLQGHDGPAYDVKFCGNGEDALLLSCGDDGRIRGWRWKEVSNLEGNIPLQGGHLKPILDLVNPQHKGPWGSASPIPENNAIAVDNKGESVFAAAGDSCAYCWDVEKSEIKMVFKGHSDYLHCIVARNSGNQIITGSEDGTARIWVKLLSFNWVRLHSMACNIWFPADCRSGKCIQVIDPEKDKKLKEFFPHVSCIALDASESWLDKSRRLGLDRQPRSPLRDLRVLDLRQGWEFAKASREVVPRAIPSVQTHSQTDLVFVLVHFCGCDIQRILSIDGHVIFMFLQSASLIAGIGCDGSGGDSYSGSGLWLEEEMKREACGNGRTLSVWNLPARECISRISTRASVQDIVFDGNQILAVGAEPLLSRYDMNGVILSQIQCAPQSVFSISLHPAGVTAVAGYGGLVDVISQFGSHLCSFRC